ncbi:Ig-like domain-containing protein [Pseudoalteromonas luteoviolacea]|uniref:Zinc metalloprotease (Elastase) n=1 Tax=Pseudoalteromonas luteoviolacea (strain 2ta16) TaxID=1353533 RepID=V4I398_PSEL2|nr:Ig-like domain-containing protein [Pseudoalteromonas luteoviolacea]ESP94709.1 Zinc metalloprotease (elastase) [Pseudoalteromonas luteoviolacea 2ta16]KZN43427.1 hypothetical protein N483_09025 [Pseudoalteromonas luteoviolacea NCIMB 1944]
MFKAKKVALLVAASVGVFSTAAAFASEPVSLHNNEQLKASIKSQLSQHQSFFRASSTDQQGELEFVTHQKTHDGRHMRRSQYYKGVRVYGGEIVTHHDEQNFLSVWFQPEGEITSISGSVVPNLSLATVKASITDKQAIEFAKEQIAELLATSDEQAELVIYPHQGKAKLAYLVTVFAETEHAPSRPEFAIDAHTGEVLSRIETLNHSKIGMGPGGNEKIGKHYYGEDMPKFHATDLGNGTCEMSDTDIRVIDMEHGTTNTETYQFPCYENTHKHVNGAYSPLNDAMFYGQATIDMFNDWFDSRALSGDLVMRIHYRKDYLNAFWNGKEVTFGDGDLDNYGVYPFTSLGVVAHEIGHGVTHQNSKLVYSNMSGGVNESFSDMTSEALECFMNQKPDGMCEVDWLIGASIFKNRTALRYMENPERDGKSIGHASKFELGMGVHHSSGVFNRAFYLLANSEGWGVKKAYEVMLHANKNFWVYNGNFESLACGVTGAAADLGYDTKAVGDAFKAVGVFACTENKAPTISITSPDSNGRYKIGSNITLKANADDEYGAVEKVEFFVNGTLHNTDLEAPYESDFSSDKTGLYTVTARVTDNEGLSADAAPLSFNLIDPSQCQTAPWQGGKVYTQGNKVAFDGFEYEAKWWNRDQNPASNSGSWGVWKKGLECGGATDKPNKAPSLSMSAPSSNTTIELGESVSVRFSASDTDGEVAKVAVSVNGQALTELTRAPYAFNYQPLEVGAYKLSAVAYDNDDAQSAEVSRAITVTQTQPEPTPEAPSVSLITPVNGSTYNVGEQIALSVVASDKDNDLKQVAYFINGKQVAVSSVAPYSANFKATSAGSYSVFAIATDAQGLSTQSTTHRFKVNASKPSCDVPAWQASSVYTSGKQASLDGQLYQAKWWTRNQNPAQYSSRWAVWKHLGECK